MRIEGEIINNDIESFMIGLAQLAGYHGTCFGKQIYHPNIMDKICSFCVKRDGIYKKRVINSIHVSGKVHVKYGTVYVCDSDSCFDLYEKEKHSDEEWIRQVTNGL
jgi:hypothetical protein